MVEGKCLTYGEMISLTCRLASGLSAAGFKPRDRLLVICHNVIEYAPLFFAVARCRGHLTTLSPSATDGHPSPVMHGRESSSQPVDHESGALTTTLTSLPTACATPSAVIAMSDMSLLLSVGRPTSHAGVSKRCMICMVCYCLPLFPN